MFWDSVEIEVTAGRGGDGRVSFRTARGEAKGGPDGGDGGNGGSVILIADRNLSTLSSFARRKVFTADSGQSGSVSRRHGKNGDDLLLHVPVGTLIREGKTALADLVTDGTSAEIARGGRGGFGNAHFTSSTRQTPRYAELGEPGVSRKIQLELKLVADAGFVGFPSVGKSTLLSRLTAAKPKIAEYPFTTVIPQLGIARYGNQEIVLADIPGLIEGAHQGKGLGDAFLRHIERTSILLHILDPTRPDMIADYKALRHELESYSSLIKDKPEIVVINKVDTLDEELSNLVKRDVEQALGTTIHLVSGASGAGLKELTQRIAGSIENKPRESSTTVPTFTVQDLAPDIISIATEGERLRVSGSRIERLAKQTDFTNPGATARFWWVFDRLGGPKQLEKMGLQAPLEIIVGEERLRWDGE